MFEEKISEEKLKQYEETLEIELKEFFIRSFDPRRNYEELILSGHKYDNAKVLKSLESDIVKYLPKYISGWNGDECELDGGSIYFGIKDNGDVIGIPYDGELTCSMISDMILKIIPKIYGKDILDLIGNIKVTISEVKPREIDTIGELQKILDEYELEMKKRKESIEQYLRWQRHIDYWHIKLLDIINDSVRKEIFLKWLNDKCDVENRESIIETVESWEVKESFGVRIPEIKTDTSQFYYWLCMFKDIVLKGYRNSKPGVYHVRNLNLGNFYYSPYLMNSHFRRMNPDMKFYVIKMDIPNQKKIIHVKKNDKYVRYERIINELGPSSIPCTEIGF